MSTATIHPFDQRQARKASGIIYSTLQTTVEKTVNQFCRKKGGDYDDLLGEAQLLFLHACKTYNSDRGASLETWVRGVVWNGLFDRLRTRLQRQRRISQEPLAPEMTPSVTDFDKLSLIDSLSPDAATAVQLVLDPPADFLPYLSDTDESGRAIRQAMKVYLHDVLKWNHQRIWAAIIAVRGAIA